MTQTATKTRKVTKVTPFEPAAFNRGTCKVTGEVFYTVKGNSDTYKLVWSEKNAAWECGCPSAIKARPCKHEVALSEHLKAREEVKREVLAQSIKAQAQEVREEMSAAAAIAEAVKITSETHEKECARCYQPITGGYIVRDTDNICTKCITEMEAEHAEREIKTLVQGFNEEYDRLFPTKAEPAKKELHSCYNCGRMTADYRCYSCAA